MQIQLKQPEIVAALRMYVMAQGINLAGKLVDISFTAGRGDSGLSASVNIEDAEIPGVEEGAEHAKPALTVVATAAAPAVKDEPAETKAVDPAPVAEVQTQAPAGKSLFG